jgi:hypothetical protein
MVLFGCTIIAAAIQLHADTKYCERWLHHSPSSAAEYNFRYHILPIQSIDSLKKHLLLDNLKQNLKIDFDKNRRIEDLPNHSMGQYWSIIYHSMHL